MMYKLEDGRLIMAPTVWNGIVGYNKDLDRLVKDGWKPLIETGEGDLVEYIEHQDHIEKHSYMPAFDYRAERAKQYPELGDVIDALIKAYKGDPSELETIITLRDIVKKNIKKPQ